MTHQALVSLAKKIDQALTTSRPFGLGAGNESTAFWNRASLVLL
jgi:hypothetical protein